MLPFSHLPAPTPALAPSTHPLPQAVAARNISIYPPTPGQVTVSCSPWGQHIVGAHWMLIRQMDDVTEKKQVSSCPSMSRHLPPTPRTGYSGGHL